MANLITLSTYKELMGIQTTATDFQLSSQIDSVSQLVKTYCNNSFVDHYSTAKVEVFSINFAQQFLQLSETPIQISGDPMSPAGVDGVSGKTITVQERDSIADSYTTLASTDFFVDHHTDGIYRSDGSTGYKSFPIGPGAVKVTYFGGYPSIPNDLRLAVVDLITYYHKDERKGRQTLAGASITNQSSTTQRNNVDFPDHIKRVLDLYKNY
tara:strand:- start:44 stop:676 length:633 start_codon:yes stop_codon:yes gene_type:complete